MWSLFDIVLVLGKGYQLFHGSPTDCESWFTSQLGLSRSPDTSTADFILNHANIDFNKSKYYKLDSLKDEEDLKEVNIHI